MRGQHDGRHVPGPRLVAQAQEDLVAGELWHRDIEDEEVGRIEAGHVDGLSAVPRDAAVMAGVLERDPDDVRDVGVVLGHEYPRHASTVCRAARAAMGNE